MKNSLFLLVLLCTFITFTACNQDEKFELESTKTANESHAATHRNCGMHHHMDQLMKDPTYKLRHAEKFEKIRSISQLRADCSSPIDPTGSSSFSGGFQSRYCLPAPIGTKSDRGLEC